MSCGSGSSFRYWLISAETESRTVIGSYNSDENSSGVFEDVFLAIVGVVFDFSELFDFSSKHAAISRNVLMI